jgi:hypothetical protein
MARIFRAQSALRILVKTFCDLEGAITAYIRFQKPDGKRGEFSAAIVDTAEGTLSHECLEGDIDISGWWVFWAYVIFEDGRTAAGEASKVFVWREGSG